MVTSFHLLGLERGPIIEVIVSRMRYMCHKLKTQVRFIGLSTALANSLDVAEWLGIDTKYTRKSPPGLFNFRPAVRPCPVTVHIEGFSEKKYCPTGFNICIFEKTNKINSIRFNSFIY